MSAIDPNTSHNEAHEEAHSGPIKTPKQLLAAVFFSLVVPIFAIIGLVYYVTSANKPAAGAVDIEKAVAQRIQKIGMVEIRDANRALKSGEEVYKAQCVTCHAAGAAGAPKFGDATAWTPRIKTGFEALWNSALKGKGAMGAQGGGDYDDIEVGRAVVYMTTAAGGKFTEPAAPAAAAPADAAPMAAPAAPAAPAAQAAPAAVVAAAPAAATVKVAAAGAGGLWRQVGALGRLETGDGRLRPRMRSQLPDLAQSLRRSRRGARSSRATGAASATGGGFFARRASAASVGRSRIEAPRWSARRPVMIRSA